MKKISMLLLILLAMVAVRMAGRAARRNADVMAALWLLLGMTATASTSGTAKSRSTEDRLNSLIPAVFPNTGGTITGSVTVNGNHNVGGQLNVNGAGGSANVAVNGNVHATSTGQFDGGVTTSVVNATSGSTSEFSGGIHAAGDILSDAALRGTTLYVNGQRIAPGQGRPAFYPVASGSSPSNLSIGVGLNEIVNCLIAAGISA